MKLSIYLESVQCSLAQMPRFHSMFDREELIKLKQLWLQIQNWNICCLGNQGNKEIADIYWYETFKHIWGKHYF